MTSSIGWRSWSTILQAVLVALVCALVNFRVEGIVVADEGWALLDFKSSISDERGVLGAWKAEEAEYPCEWHGVSCDMNFHVSSINLRNSGLSGTISPELRRLRRLKILNLSGNNFSGPIPSQLSQIGSLWKLKLDHNDLAGTIPEQLGHLSNLRIFDLSYNGLSGLIPEAIFRTCHRLRFVSLAQNRLTGSLPASLHNCVKLAGFDFSSNALRSNIGTVDLTKLKELNYVDLQSNSFSGQIPKGLGSLGALRYINLGDNLLSGSLPAELKRLGGLQRLSLNNNLLSGEVSADIISLPGLQHLDLSGNTFRGMFRLEGRGCTSLRGLNLAGNMLEGDIPLTLSNCSRLEFLNLANNRLNGSLRADIGGLAHLKFLDASGNRLVGEIPASIAGLNALSALVLRNNRIDGRIPSEIGSIKALEILDLSNMRLEGGIPPELHGCSSLQKLDLSSNELNGSIPADLGKLSGLKELDLESNRLTGGIPAALGNLTGLVIFNVSHNHLSGKMPRENALAHFGFESFLGNPDLCGTPWGISCQEVVPPATPPARTPKPADNVKDRRRRPFLTNTGIFVIAITAAVAVAASGISLLSALIRRKKQRSEEEFREEKSIDSSSGLEAPVGKLVLLNGVHSSTYYDTVEKGIRTLLDERGIIGRGSIGTVYKATFSDGKTIAVKKLRTLARRRDAEAFEADMRSLDNLRHQNLVELQGYYLSSRLKLTLSEFVPNGTLSDHLHRNPSAVPLTWWQRYSIGLGIARGLVELHCNRCPPIMHFNLTSANVMLDESLEAKISDYGLSKFLPIQNKYISSRIYHETLAYVAPELACGSLRVSEKCDVYSFGVVLLELATGRKPSAEINGTTVLLGDLVRSKLEQERLRDCIDPRLGGSHEYEIINVIKMALLCTSQEPSSRPTMAEAVQILESLDSKASSASSTSSISSTSSVSVERQSSCDSSNQWRE